MTTTDRQPTITPELIDALAVDLVMDLAPHAGDPAAVARVLIAWLNEHDVAVLAFTAMAAVRDTFGSYLTPTHDVPPGALVLESPHERN